MEGGKMSMEEMIKTTKRGLLVSSSGTSVLSL
jgi:predicted Zn-dependent protease